jgi:hypothetical protein
MRQVRRNKVPRYAAVSGDDQDRLGPIWGRILQEIVRTNDPVLISAIEALLAGAAIPHMVLDQNMSVLEGSLGILPRRVLVASDYAMAARRLLEDAGFGHELRPMPKI